MTGNASSLQGNHPLASRLASHVSANQGGEGAVHGAAYRSSMRAIAGAVMIVSSRNGNISSGTTVTAAISLSDSPPLIGIALNKQASVHDLVQGSGLLSINVLSQHHRCIAEVFAGRGGIKGERRFECGSWSANALGLRILDDAASVLIGRVVSAIDCSTHTLFVLAVTDCSTGGAVRPLLYHDGQFGSLSISMPEQS